MERLELILENLPDGPLIQKLKSIRGNGRNEWPVEAMWNSFVASFIFDHDSIASLIRELNRNSQLRLLCGFQPHLYSVLTKEKDEYGRRIREEKYKLAPTASAYTNFLNNLRECQTELREMFDSLVEYMYENLADFGEILAADGKAVQSYAAKLSNKNSGNCGEKDADWCRKTYTATTPDGEKITKTKKWFGFRLHLISDATYELPVDFEVTKASNSELKETEKLLEGIKENRPKKLERCRYFLADRGYDKSRDCQRYGFHPRYHDKRVFRIPLKTDPRIFTKVARNSKKWKRLYKKRTSIERINGRIDRDFQFEKHTIRGLGKMKLFLTVTLIIQLASAKAKIEGGVKKGLARHCA